MAFKAEYMWIDGTEPTPSIRSKTKVVPDGTNEFPIWGFDGSSTNQAPGDNSDCVLRPVYSCPDPITGEDNVLVMCEVLLPDMTPHPTNTRAACAEVAKSMKKKRLGSESSKNIPSLNLMDLNLWDFLKVGSQNLKALTIVG